MFYNNGVPVYQSDEKGIVLGYVLKNMWKSTLLIFGHLTKMVGLTGMTTGCITRCLVLWHISSIC